MRDFQAVARSIRTRPTGDGADVAPVGDLTARREAAYARRVSDALDAQQSTDDGFAVAAVALPTPHAAGAPGEKETT
jgi:hypothetical protein